MNNNKKKKNSTGRINYSFKTLLSQKAATEIFAKGLPSAKFSFELVHLNTLKV